jgi:hypothetical protein
VTTAYQKALGSSYNFIAYGQLRTVLDNSDISVGGNSIRIRLQGHASLDYTIDSCTIGERSGTSSDFASAPTRITFDSGNNSVTVTAGTTKWSDWISFSLDETKDYLVHFAHCNNYAIIAYTATPTPCRTYCDFVATDQSFDLSFATFYYSETSQIDTLEVTSGGSNTNITPLTMVALA